MLVYHVIEHTAWAGFPVAGGHTWWRIGWMGVDLFFVLSGFVIFLSANGLYEKLGNNWWRTYAIHRFVRIAPLYFLTLLVFLFLISPGLLFLPADNLLFQLFSHAAFLHNLFPSTHGAINGANWSIGVEVQFYIFVFLFFNWLRQASAVRVLITLCAVASIWKLAVFLLLPDALVSQRWFLTTQLPGVLDEFAFGIVACKLILGRKQSAERLGAKNSLFLALSGGSVWLMLSLFWAIGAYWESVWAVAFFRILMGLVGALLILAAIGLPESWPFKINRPLDYLGEISYGVYLWHLPVILSLKRLDLPAGGTFLAVTIISSVVLAGFSYHMFERPWVVKGRQYA